MTYPTTITPPVTLVPITPPTTRPVSLDEVKLHVRIDGALEDSLVDDLIRGATEDLEGTRGYLGCALLTQTWNLILDRFPCSGDELYVSTPAPGFHVPLPPLQSITSIKYLDPAGAQQTLDPTTYVVDTKSSPGRVLLAPGKAWPGIRTGYPNAVEVQFVAGYGTAAAVPDRIRTWLKEAVAYKYLHREAPTLPTSFFWELADYKAAWIF